MPKRKLTPKRLLALRGYIETGTLLGAASFIGHYKNNNSAMASVHRILNEPDVQEAMAEALYKRGMDVEKIAENLVELTEAEEIRFFSKDGIVKDERNVPDNASRLKAIDLIAKYLGLGVQKCDLKHSGSTTTPQNSLETLTDEELDLLIAGGDADSVPETSSAAK